MHSFCKIFVLVLIALLSERTVYAENAVAKNNVANRLMARNTIVEKDLSKYIDFLTDDAIQGREAGSSGGHTAAKYLTQQFTKIGLEPAGANNRFDQPFPGQMRNIIGMIPGSDPELSKEFILVSAHYDHIGYGSVRNSNGPIGYIHNGADDNASGVSGLMELAEAVKNLPTAPKRTIIFALWDGEEVNLLGSKHWIKEPTRDLSKVKAVVNIDMIGRLRNNKLMLYGSRTATGWRKLACNANRDAKLNLEFNWEMKADSDHHPFFEAGIPVLMLHTGLHEDYHRPSDDKDKINFNGLENVSRFLFELTVDLAEELPVGGFRTASREESPAVQLKREKPLAPFPSRLGVQWTEPKPNDEPGLLVSDIFEKSPAQSAGLMSGDRLLKIGNEEITSTAQFRRIILSTKKSVELTYQRPGEKENRTASVELTGETIRWGISWRVDDAEPSSVLVARVISGTPADEKGLKPGDRIYSVNDQNWSDQEQFQALLDRPEASFLVERDGLFRTIEVKRLESPEPSIAVAPADKKE